MKEPTPVERPASPSAQRVTRRNVLGSWTLGALTFIGLMLTVYEAFRLNDDDLKQSWPDLLARAEALALFTASLVAYLARDQFARLTKPSLQYRARFVRQAQRLAPDGGATWQIVLLNTGPGTVDIDQVRFYVRARDQQGTKYAADVTKLRAFLQEVDLKDSADYWLVNYSPQSGLASRSKQVYFECTHRATEVLEHLVAVFQFTSAVGDRYEKYITLHRPDTASSSVLEDVSYDDYD